MEFDVAPPAARHATLPAITKYIYDTIATPSVEVVWVDEFTPELGMLLLQQRQDKRYSLCDAISFEIMRQRTEYLALTTDHHFEQEGFVRLLPGSQTP